MVMDLMNRIVQFSSKDGLRIDAFFVMGREAYDFTHTSSSSISSSSWVLGIGEALVHDDIIIHFPFLLFSGINWFNITGFFSSFHMQWI